MKPKKLAICMLLTALICASLSLFVACEYTPTIRVNFYVDGTVYSVQTITDNTVKLPDPPQKEGYVFDGWYLDNQTFESAFTGIFEITPTTSINVYAKWKSDGEKEDKTPDDEKPSETSVRVNFYVDGIIYAIRDTVGKELTLPTVPVKSGCVFDGWYLDDETFKSAFTGIFDTMPIASVDVYAKWKLRDESDSKQEAEDVPTDLYYDYKEHVKLFSQIEGATVECVDDPDILEETTKPDGETDIFGNTPYIANIEVSWPGINHEDGWGGIYSNSCSVYLFYFKSNADAIKAKKAYLSWWKNYCEEEADEEDGEMLDLTIIIQGNIMVCDLEDYYAETFKKMIRTKVVEPVSFEIKLFSKHGYLLQNQTITAEDFIVCLDFATGWKLEGRPEVITSVVCNTQSLGKTTATVKFKYNNVEYTVQNDFEVINETHEHYFILENHFKLKELGYKFNRSTLETCLLYDESIFDGLLRWNDDDNKKVLIGKIGGYSEGMLAKSFSEEFIVTYFDTEEHAKQYYEIYKDEKNIVLSGKIAYIDMHWSRSNAPWALSAKKAVEKNKYIEPEVCELTATCKEGVTFTSDWQYEQSYNYVITYKYKVDDEVFPGDEPKRYDIEVTNVEHTETYAKVTITYKNCSTTITIPKNN